MYYKVILGIDFGIKRVGLALTDKLHYIAFPYKTIYRTTRKALFAELSAIIAKEQVGQVVVGLPFLLDGGETETTAQARNFAVSLGRRVDIPVHLVDERLSSFAAAQELQEAGLFGEKHKSVLDQQAAVQILKAWLVLQEKKKNET